VAPKPLHQSAITTFLPQFTILRQMIQDYWIVAIAGLCMALSLSPSPLWPLAWVAIVPLWRAILQSKHWQAALKYGAVWGIAYQGAALSWVWGLHPLTWLGVPWLGSVAITAISWIVITLWGATVAILFSLGLWWIGQRWKTCGCLLLGVTLWCGLESLWEASPLWWTAIANSQSPHNLVFSQLARFSGPTILSAALVLVNGILAEAWLHRQKKGLSIALACVALFHLGGWFLYSTVTPLTNPNVSPNIGIVQGNLPSRFKLSPEGQRRSVEQYSADYQTLVSQGADAVLMPEGTFPFLWGRFSTLQQIALAPLHKTSPPLWAGTFVPKNNHYTQSLVEFNPNGTFKDRYNKVKLVPLGEYLPFADQLQGILRNLSPIELRMIPGSDRQQFTTRLGQATVSICYESAFPELLRRQTAAGGQFILSVANNDPFGTRMMAQHHALDVLRAIENDRWLVRATNTGLSAIITPQGITQWQSLPKQHTLHLGQIQLRNTRTGYVLLGNWLLSVLLISSFGFIAITWWPTLNSHQNSGYAKESRNL
jgi:apolipoprotein N-acyltransferase